MNKTLPFPRTLFCYRFCYRVKQENGCINKNCTVDILIFSGEFLDKKLWLKSQERFVHVTPTNNEKVIQQNGLIPKQSLLHDSILLENFKTDSCVYLQKLYKHDKVNVKYLADLVYYKEILFDTNLQLLGKHFENYETLPDKNQMVRTEINSDCFYSVFEIHMDFSDEYIWNHDQSIGKSFPRSTWEKIDPRFTHTNKMIIMYPKKIPFYQLKKIGQLKLNTNFKVEYEKVHAL